MRDSVHVDNLARIASELLRRDITAPDLHAGERFVIDFRAPPAAGNVVLVYAGGRFRLAIAPVDGWVVGIVRLAV